MKPAARCGIALGALSLALACGFLVSPAGRATSSATCTYEQKQARTQAVTAFSQKMATARAAYFRRHKDARQRAAFVKAQNAKLRELRRAASCVVPPLPASSGASCSPRLEQRPGGGLNEGVVDPAYGQAAVGRIGVLLLFLAYPNAPASANTASIASTIAPAADWFREVSNGRLTVDVTPLERWLTMPQPTSAYNPVQNGDNMYRYVRDAVSIADPLVDFSRYDDVALVNAPGWASGDLAISLSAAGFPPVVADGKPIRFGTFYGGDQPAMLASRMRDVFIHETLHTLGLPDLGGRAVGYDPLAVNDLPQPTHVLGWHKWILGWIDPLQITCVASGTLEETLSPIAVAAGKKLVVVPVDEWTAYVVEARRRIGWDRNLCDEGVILYRVDSRRMGGDDPVLMNGPLRCGRFTPGAFDPGQTVEDEHVRLQVLATDGQSYRVRVTKK